MATVPSEQYSAKAITDPVNSSGIRGTVRTPLKTVSFRKYCNSRETLDWEVIFGKILHFILIFFSPDTIFGTKSSFFCKRYTSDPLTLPESNKENSPPLFFFFRT